MDKREDEFLWWQRRAVILLCVGIFAYGIVERPILLLMTPLLVLVCLGAVGRILRDRSAPPRKDIAE